MSPRSPIGPIALIALLTLMSCSGDSALVEQPDKPDKSGQPITFLSGLVPEQAVTRAQGLEEIATTFRVWAYKNTAYDAGSGRYTAYQTVMNSYHVDWTANTASTTTSNTHDWEYVGARADQTIKYWDWGANAYRFFALAGGVAGALEPHEAHEAHGANGPQVSETQVNFDFTADVRTAAAIEAIPYYSHLWFSDGNISHYENRPFGQPVKLEFLKPLVHVRFMFRQSNPEAVFLLNDPEFKSVIDERTIATAGTFTVSYPLTGTETQELWAVSSPTATIPALTRDYYESNDPTDENARKWYTVLPAKADDQGSYKLTVEVNGVTREAVVPKGYMNWEPGYSYTYIFKITENGGVVIESVEAAFTPWTNAGEEEHSIYNW